MLIVKNQLLNSTIVAKTCKKVHRLNRTSTVCTNLVEEIFHLRLKSHIHNKTVIDSIEVETVSTLKSDIYFFE